MLGGVAHKPWRSAEAEAALAGKPASEESFRRPPRRRSQDAKPLAHNAYKVELGEARDRSRADAREQTGVTA